MDEQVALKELLPEPCSNVFDSTSGAELQDDKEGFLTLLGC